MRMMRHNRALLAGMALSLLALAAVGCVGKDGTARAPTISPTAAVAAKKLDVRPLCLPVKNYTPEEQKALADSVSKLADTDPIVTAMGDYAHMRAEARACLAFK